MNQVIIIGTEPPCPRCALLTRVFKEMIARLGIDARVRHLSYTDAAAIKFAAGLGLTAGTAKDVAISMGTTLDLLRIKELIENAVPNPGCEFYEFNSYKWTRELDHFLKPFELKAKQGGILMTPVVIINGKLKYSASIPALKDIIKWLEELNTA